MIVSAILYDLADGSQLVEKIQQRVFMRRRGTYHDFEPIIVVYRFAHV
jgi:hypothetical protein